MANIRELAKKSEPLSGGHRACAGCAAPVVVRQALLASDKPVVVGCATGCLEVTTTIFPFTAWNVPFIHNAFENSAATVSGVEAAYRSLKKKGKLDKEMNFIAFGGDGGTYDIGLQSLSGAMERGHRMLYICYDNGAYMNTGIQRSSATPFGANTTTSPAGKKIPGKMQFKKDLTGILAAHNIPYAAQASVGYWNDFVTKVQKALAAEGPSFINVLSPCRLGWGFPPEQTMEIAREAVTCRIWPLYEVVNGACRITLKPKEFTSPIQWMKKQNRFRHVFQPGNEWMLKAVEEHVEKEWQDLIDCCGHEKA
ncbi:MAG: thiamine pyrophosphate-dependent enzyme [Bacillota bacterium]